MFLCVIFSIMNGKTSTSSRGKLVDILQNNHRMTITELAESLEITPVAVRHHLVALLADGMVEVTEERHGVGRPRLIYRLSETALDHNPSMYSKFADLLLEELNVSLPPETVNKLLSGVAASMVGEWRNQLDGLSLSQRLHRLVQLLKEEGISARVESHEPGRWDLLETTCPYSRISQHHPEVCALDASILSRALNAEVERKTCIQSGSDSCRFLITDAG
jgi:DeoR family transcriptional regulator, suf operon transcriptional repressor